MTKQNERGGEEDSKDLMSLVLGSFKSSKHMTANRRAYLVWIETNGEREVEHTTGVFVRKNPRDELPILTIYVDNRMCMIDFLAQREIYRARLSEKGLDFSELEFRLDKYKRHQGKSVHLKEEKKKISHRLVELSSEEKEQISLLVKNMEEPLKTKAYKAIEASFKYNKSV